MFYKRDHDYLVPDLYKFRIFYRSWSIGRKCSDFLKDIQLRDRSRSESLGDYTSSLNQGP